MLNSWDYPVISSRTPEFGDPLSRRAYAHTPRVNSGEDYPQIKPAGKSWQSTRRGVSLITGRQRRGTLLPTMTCLPTVHVGWPCLALHFPSFLPNR